MLSEIIVKSAETALPSNLDETQAAAWPLLLALFRAVKQIQIELGESVLVSGNGPVGLVMAQLASIAGAGRLVGLASDSNQPATERIVWTGDFEQVGQLLPQGQADVLIETTGDPAKLEKLLACMRGGGRVLLLTSNAASQANFDFYPHLHRRSLMLKSLTLQAVLAEAAPTDLAGERETGFLAHLLRSGRMNLADLTGGEQFLSASPAAGWADRVE